MNFKIGIISIVILITTSIYLRVLLQLVGQRWITTLAHTATLVILPIITYIITSVISGNIALSLGMVGALSIVRFRNPVRSPLELSVYFGAITMGISASISFKWLIFFVVAVTLASIVLILVNFLYSYFLKKSFFTASFSEGNSLSTLEIKASENIDLLDKSNLLNIKKVNNNEIEYVMIGNNFEDLKELQEKISEDNKILNYQLNR